MESHTQAEGRRNCLDMMPVHWVEHSGESHKVCATILEISPHGALLHVDEAVPVGTGMELLVGGEREFNAQVTATESDKYGYYLTVHVDESWFPNEYQPAYLRPADEEAFFPSAAESDNSHAPSHF